jgi:DNA polymerase eta
MLASKNLPTPIRKDGDTVQWIRVLCAELAVRLLEARETGTVWPKTIVLHTKQGKQVLADTTAFVESLQVGESAPRSKQGPFPYVRNLTGDIIVNAAMKLWRELHGTDAERAANPNAPVMKINNISIAFTGVEALEQGQRGIEGFFGSALPGPSNDRVKEGAAKEEIQAKNEAETVEYSCPKCSKTLVVSIQQDDGEELRAAKVEAVKAEHEDFHFAQQLSRQDKLVIGGGKRRHSPSRVPQKRKKKDEGILTYFQKM